MKAYAMIETLNGNYKLKTLSEADKANDNVEIEFYGTNKEVKQQFKKHLKQLKKGL